MAISTKAAATAIRVDNTARRTITSARRDPSANDGPRAETDVERAITNVVRLRQHVVGVTADVCAIADRVYGAVTSDETTGVGTEAQPSGSLPQLEREVAIMDNAIAELAHQVGRLGRI